MRIFPVLVIVLLACVEALTPSPALAADEKSVISGTVYFDRNRDGSPAGEPGLRGVQVTLVGPKSSQRASTDAKGGYAFDQLPAGQYTVSATPIDKHQLTTASGVVVKVDGRTNRVVDFGMADLAPTPSPSASPTPRVTATPTVTPTPVGSSLVQRPSAAGSPGPENESPAIQSALDDRAWLAGSPAPIAIAPAMVTPTATPNGGRGGVPDEAVRLRAASLEPLRYVAGRDRLSLVKRYENGQTIWLGVPFRTQMDGTFFSQVNCGPATLSMAMGAFGISLDPDSIREYVNYLSGSVDPDSGTSLDNIAGVAREAGLRTLDLYNARGYRVWDLTLVRQHVAQGHPVITLTRYQSLPGNADSRFNADHYVVITGLSGDDFIYNDPAFGSNDGYGLLISGPDLERAWVFSSIPAHGLALGLDGDAQIPDWLRHRAETRSEPAPTPAVQVQDDAADVEVAEPMTYVGQVPGDQELPTVNADSMAQALDRLAAPRVSEQAFIGQDQSLASAPPAEIAEAVAAPDALERTAQRTARLAEVFVLDPTLITLFLALLGIFLPPALSRRRGGR